MELNMKKMKPLHLTLRKEKVREESFMTGKIKVKYQALFGNVRRRFFHTFNASNVRSTDTILDSVAVQRRGKIKPQLLILMKILNTKGQEMMILNKVQKIVERSSSSSTIYVETVSL